MKTLIYAILALVFSLNVNARELGLTLDEFTQRYSEQVKKSTLSDTDKDDLLNIAFETTQDPDYQMSSSGGMMLVVADPNHDGSLNMTSIIYPSGRDSVTDKVLVARMAVITATAGDAVTSSKDASYIRSIPGVRRDGGRAKVVNGFKLVSQTADEGSQMLSVENFSNRNPGRARAGK